MTIHSRNRILLISSILSAIFVFAIIVACIFTGTSEDFSYTQPAIRLFSISDTFFLFRFNLPSAISAICVLGLFVPLTGFYILFNFEKTQSPEIIYYAGFLVGCLPELLRLLIIIFNLSQGYSQFLFFASRVVFFGRMMTSLNLLFLGIFSGSQQPQDADRNFILIAAGSTVFAILIPINSYAMTTAGTPEYGFFPLLTLCNAIFFAITFATLFYNGTIQGVKEYQKAAFHFITMYAGYIVLKYADNIAYATVGSILFCIGNYFFIRNIHRYYLWK